MEYRRKAIFTVLGVLAFLGCCALVLMGQKNIGPTGLITMLAGLTGIVLCLWVYNITHR